MMNAAVRVVSSEPFFEGERRWFSCGVGLSKKGVCVRGCLAVGVMVWLCFLLSGCAAPVRELTAYRDSFRESASATESMILTAKNDARAHADSPWNPDPISVRQGKLAQNLAAMDARLAALDVVTGYNEALLALAKGGDPKELQGAISALQTTLNSLAPKLSAIAGPAAPVVGVVSELLIALQNAVNLQKMRDALRDGGPKVKEILVFLQEDSKLLAGVRWSFLTAEFSGELREFQKRCVRAKGVFDRFGPSASLSGLLSQLNELRSRTQLSFTPVGAAAGAEPVVASAMAHESSADETMLIENEPLSVAFASDQISQAQEFARRMDAVQMRAIRLGQLTDAYRQQLGATASALDQAMVAAQNPSLDFVSATGLLTSTLRGLREAEAAYKEAK